VPLPPPPGPGRCGPATELRATVDPVQAHQGGTRLGLRLAAVVAATGLAAVVSAAAAGHLDSAPSAGPVQTVALLVVLGLAGFLGLEFRANGQGNRVDLFDAALAPALISLPGGRLLVLVVVAKAVALLAHRVPLHKTCFNLAQWACAAGAGSLVFAGLRGPAPSAARELAALVAALLVVALLNNAAVVLVMRTVGGASVVRPGARSLLRGVAVGALVNLGLGVLLAVLWAQSPVARPAIPIALVVVHLGTRGWAHQQTGTLRLVGLQRASAALAGPDDLRTATPRFLAELRQAFECAGVELHVQLGPDGQWCRATSGQDAGPERSAPLVAELLRRGTAVHLSPTDGDPELQALLASAGWRACLAAPVRFEDRVVGLLCTHDRQGWEGFESAELAVLEAAANVLSESVHRGELAELLQSERAALSASEARWRALARILEQVARGTPLSQTLDLLATALEEQTPGTRCAVLVAAPGAPLALAAPGLPPYALPALESGLRPALAALRTPGEVWSREVASLPDGRSSNSPADRLDGETLLRAEVRSLRVWALPCSPESGATGVLALCSSAAPASAAHDALAESAARVAALAVDHVLVQHRLAHQAAHDALTDLPNRGVFLDRLGRALRSTERDGTKVLVLFLDLDRFKVVNDSLGHRAGDALLCEVAERLRAAVRPGDTVARFGGDEFTMLCEDIADEAHALQVVQRVQAALERPFALGSSELFATSSIGIALGHGGTQAPETLVEDADAAMYRAKDRGGNCYELFDAAMRDRAVRRLATQSALHRAIEREEFRVVYQPTVRLATGDVEGVEALVRWDRPDHGTVQPGEFVPLAEETGLIVPIGAYVLEEACQQARGWRDAAGGGLPPSISINLSARQLTDPGLVAMVAGALQRNGIDPATIALEITESVLMSDVTASGLVLSELKSLGVRLYVDDFGTGYSSLTYLQRFPMDGVKVDQSFVAGLGTEPGAAAIVGGVIGLAHGLGLVAVAEGVETRDQVERLIDLDCDIAQGFHFGRPGAADLVRVGQDAAPLPSLTRGR